MRNRRWRSCSGSPYANALDLREAAALAIQQQPLLTSLDAQAHAAREASVASAQLPDPQLFGGVRDLPIDGQDAYSLSNDSDTQLVLGVSQEFPRAAKRKLRASSARSKRIASTANATLAELSIRRDASLAWLECWRAESAQRIARADTRRRAVAGRRGRNRRCGPVLQRSPTTSLHC